MLLWEHRLGVFPSVRNFSRNTWKTKAIPLILLENGIVSYSSSSWYCKNDNLRRQVMLIPNFLILVGHSAKEFTPTYRGFDSHFGYWLGKQDYYSHISVDGKDSDVSGYFLLELKFCRIMVFIIHCNFCNMTFYEILPYFFSCSICLKKTIPTTFSTMVLQGNSCWGYDFRNNTEIHRTAFGQYE